VSTLGKVIDYEVPLKQIQGAPHGDIDLLSVNCGEVMLIEAKRPTSSESILKAILEAFVYSSLISTVRHAFLKDFSLKSNSLLIPVVLTFHTAISGKQLDKINEFPRLRQLVTTLNRSLARRTIEPIRFLVVENCPHELETCLTTTRDANGVVKVKFREGFVPVIAEITF
jgi:hypothetical protein